MTTPFLQLNLNSVEHVWVEYYVAESDKLLYIDEDLNVSPILFLWS
jgi:hypothetical protein